MDKKKRIHQPGDDKEVLSVRRKIEPLIAGYLTNDLSEDDLVILYNWMYADKNNKDLFNHLKSVWIVSGTVNKPSWNRDNRIAISNEV
jgi:hypothetical protein